MPSASKHILGEKWVSTPLLPSLSCISDGAGQVLLPPHHPPAPNQLSKSWAKGESMPSPAVTQQHPPYPGRDPWATVVLLQVSTCP